MPCGTGGRSSPPVFVRQVIAFRGLPGEQSSPLLSPIYNVPMPTHGSTRPPYVAYCFLALLFSISLTYRTRNLLEYLDVLLHPANHVRAPLEIDGPDFSLSALKPEARAAGIQNGDILVSANNRPLQGYTGFYSLLSHARPGERLTIQVRPPKPAGAAPRNVSIELQPALTSAPKPDDWIALAITAVAMPFLCLALGYWIALVRIRDKQAWLVLALLLSFAEFFGAVGGFYGQEGPAQPFFIAYHVFFANLISAALLLFAVYFPERLPLDRKFPWAKWLIAVPVLLGVAAIATIFPLFLHHAALALTMLRALSFFLNPLSFFHLAVVALAFIILGYKTVTAGNRDARRRLLLLAASSAVSVTPTVAWLILRATGKLASLPEWVTLLTIVLFFLFPVTLAYVIVVQRAMDVRVVIRQGLRYLLASGSVRVFQTAISIAIIGIAASMSMDRSANLLSRAAFIIAGFVLLAFTRMFAERVRRWIDRRFFREAYNAEQILSDLASRVRTMVETSSVLEIVAHRISESLHVPRVAILLNGRTGFQLAYGLGYPASPDISLPEDSATVQRVKKDQPAAVRFDNSDSWVEHAGTVERDSLAKLQPELLLPLSLNQKLLGIMSLGPKQSEEPFTRSDIQLLDSVATQTGLALENSRLTAEIAAEVAQRERMNRELEIAREVQERLFPQTTPSIPGIEVAGFCRPALGVGGDYYDYFALCAGDLGIAVGDVSGKGIPAALLMASLRASLRAQTMRAERDLAALMTNVNTLGYESSTANKYATFFYGQYSPQSRLLRYVNAGHEPPLIFRADELIRLETGGPVVGLLPAVRYEQGSIQLEPGDLLIAFTDGISEAMNHADEEWTVERLVDCVRDAGEMSCRDLIHHVIAAADSFAAGAKQHDDMTIIVARIT